MTNEFTDWCSYYYQLKVLLSEQEEHFKNMLANAPLYRGQTRLSEMDAMLDYYAEVQAEKARADKLAEQLTATGKTVLAIIQHFEIPTYTVLTGEIPGELEYELWADGKGQIHIRKTRDLAPADNDNIIVIRGKGF